jgi:hypothetical protein
VDWADWADWADWTGRLRQGEVEREKGIRGSGVGSADKGALEFDQVWVSLPHLRACFSTWYRLGPISPRLNLSHAGTLSSMNPHIIVNESTHYRA